MVLAAIVTSLVLTVLPAHAAARHTPLSSNPVAAAVSRARAYAEITWNGVPCGGNVSVVGGSSSEAPPAGMNAAEPAGVRAAMWASWQTPDGVNDFDEPPSSFSECVVHMNTAVWPTWLAEDRDFPAFCKEMIHEFGHFAGYQDAGARRGSVQYERPDLAMVPSCERYRLLYGHLVFSGPPDRRPRRGSGRPAQGPERR